MKKFLKVLMALLLLLMIAVSAFIYSNLRDQNPGYKADMLTTRSDSSGLLAGFAAVSITPEVPDRWTDANNDAQYDPSDGDTFIDGNGNGKFDPVWIAGFDNARAAYGIHDDLWARTMVVDDGRTRLAIVALDLIGLMNNEVIDIRAMIPESAGITYSIIGSTHTHEGPDLLGLWGKTPFRSGVDRDYMEYVKKRIAESVVAASARLRPVILEVSEDMTGACHQVRDTREPQVFDCGLRLIRAVDRESGETAGTLISWANHPETLWGDNLMITSDFPHFLRESVEKGVFSGDSLLMKGTGGVALYLNGAIGGLMTTHPSVAVKDPVTGAEFSKPTFEKAEAQSKELALLILKAMEEPQTKISEAGISIAVKTLRLPIDNKMFRIGNALGVFHRGMTGWMNMRTEVAAITLGPLSICTFPGEVYPEIINGPADNPEGADFGTAALVMQPIRDLMGGKHKLIIGLANDEIGYIIPKSQWDEKEPYTYGKAKPQYGEENSLGPETAVILYGTLKELIASIKK